MARSGVRFTERVEVGADQKWKYQAAIKMKRKNYSSTAKEIKRFNKCKEENVKLTPPTSQQPDKKGIQGKTEGEKVNDRGPQRSND